jgi:hypothetical protein
MNFDRDPFKTKPVFKTQVVQNENKKNKENNDTNIKPLKMTEGLKVSKMLDNNDKFETTKAMEAGLTFKHPARSIIVGGSGSGKTNMCSFMLLNKDMFYKYFDEIYILATTGATDPTFKLLGVPEKNIITENLEEKCEELFLKFKKDVEGKNIQKSKMKKRLIIFEDITAEKKLMNSKAFIKLFSESRHYGVSVIAVCHKYKAMNRTCRLNTNRIMFFPMANDEIEAVIEDFNPPNVSFDQMMELFQTAFTKTPDNERPFIQIDVDEQDITKKFLKSFDTRLYPQLFREKVVSKRPK